MEIIHCMKSLDKMTLLFFDLENVCGRKNWMLSVTY